MEIKNMSECIQNVGAADSSVSSENVSANATMPTAQNDEVEVKVLLPMNGEGGTDEDNQKSPVEKDGEVALLENVFEDELATAIDSIYTRPYCDNRGDMEIINPLLKLTYSICPSTPTVSMQKDAISRLLNVWKTDKTYPSDHTRVLTNSYKVKQVLLNPDTVSFIGSINKSHEPLVDIQSMLRKEWERASLTSQANNQSHSKGMEIILN